MVVVVLVGIGVLIFSSDAPGYWQNIYITGVGAALTVLFLDRQAEHRAERQRKEELISQMGSQDNGFTVEAVRLLRKKDWLADGSLKWAFLWEANLEGVNLRDANLQGANLSEANLSGASLSGASFKGANLSRANLEWTNLQGAESEEETNLEEANLSGANLQGARLWEPNLSGANLSRASLEGVRLPDGTRWTPDADMTRFTDPKHPNFWSGHPPDDFGNPF